MELSLLEKKILKKQQGQFADELREVTREYAEKLNELLGKYDFVSRKDHGNTEGLKLVREALDFNYHDYYFFAKYQSNVQIPALCQEAILENAIDQLLEKGELK